MNTNDQNESADAKALADRPTASADATPAAEKSREILVRLKPHEIKEIKDDTGADAEATAVACFVRKNLRKRA